MSDECGVILAVPCTFVLTFMAKINTFIENLNPYKVASHKVWEVAAAERAQMLKLDWNEATIAPSPKVREALLQVIQDEQSFSLYPNTHNHELLGLLAGYSGVQTNEIQYFASPDAAHMSACTGEFGLNLWEQHVLILGPHCTTNFSINLRVSRGGGALCGLYRGF